ncbi:MAG: HAD family phosphatase [Deltaproteobacteria bacterium]|nr:HAD family phosphatase [Deltaproteobacteria bacterium]
MRIAIFPTQIYKTVTVRALIFDFDGVLVNTEPFHMKAWQEVAVELGFSFTREEYNARYIGLNDRDFITRLCEDKQYPLPPKLSKELIHKKATKTREIFSHTIPMIEGSEEFLKNSAKKYPLALVTGGLPDEVYFILDKKNWRKLFSVIVTAEDVVKGKPDPEGFLKAFGALQNACTWNPPLKKDECLIFEDSVHGSEAAKRAGIPCQIIKNTFAGITGSL